MRRLIILIALILPCVVVAGDDVYLKTLAGKICSDAMNQKIECTYTVGNDLKFVIGPIGDEYNSVTFLRSFFDGDYYATFGILHGCVIIKPGKKTIESDDYMFGQLAFVSPKNGKVYSDWAECRNAR
jgi:hypothetical protein